MTKLRGRSASKRRTVTLTRPIYQSSGAALALYVNGTSITLAKPTGVVENDILIARLHIEATPAKTLTLPSGWTQKAAPTGAAPLTNHVIWKRATASEPADYAFSWTGTAWANGNIHRIGSAVTTGDPFASSASAYSATATIPSLSYTGTATGLGIWLSTVYNNDLALDPPTGYVESAYSSRGSSVLGTRSDEAGSLTTGTAGGSTVGQAVFAGVLLPSTGGSGGSGYMTPPAGATLLGNLTTASAWDISESPSTFTAPETVAGTGPEGDPIIRNTLVDGQRATWDPSTNERNDYRVSAGSSVGAVPLGAERTMIWHERFITMPTTSSQWQLVGPCEVHGDGSQGMSQAPFQPWVEPTTKRRQFDATYGTATHTYYNVSAGAVVLNEWHNCMFKVKYINNTTGWWEFWYDGVKVASAYNIATTQGEPGYWKYGNYRAAVVNGDSVYDISSCRLYTGT